MYSRMINSSPSSQNPGLSKHSNEVRKNDKPVYEYVPLTFVVLLSSAVIAICLAYILNSYHILLKKIAKKITIYH